MVERLEVRAQEGDRYGEILTADALDFLARLHREFEPTRKDLLHRRFERQRLLDGGALPDFLPHTSWLREGRWYVSPAPPDLVDRRVELTGPVDAKTMINALNSGARVFMADFEDATSPTWPNIMGGQANLMDAVRRRLAYTAPNGAEYGLADRVATLVVRPRGWHLLERHLALAGEPVSASLVDFGLYFFHNARELIERDSGPYFYLPKLESHLEARLWNDVFEFSQDFLGVPLGNIKATVLIETLPAAFEMDEILYELKDHVVGLNAGRWDYIFSSVKRLRERPDFVLPDRSQVTMTVPFMRAYTELLVQTCHRRAAHAMGGMAAFVPSRRDPSVNERAFEQVRADKEREAADGFDGTWVAHPDLVPLATEIFDAVLGAAPNQIGRPQAHRQIAAQDLLDTRIPNGEVTEAGLRTNVGVALRYLMAWLEGTGAVSIHNLMEDAATAEICRAQVWQWMRHGVRLREGPRVTADLVRQILDEEEAKIREAVGTPYQCRLEAARRLFEQVALDESFAEFLTLIAYESLANPVASQSEQ
jgi:malate synthase